MSNPRVFMDISINQRPPERMIIELFADVVPKTAENFRALCVGAKSPTGKHLHYKGCVFHNIIKAYAAEGGDFENENGTGEESIYGKTFPVENFQLRHSGPGILSMANKGRNKIGSRFILTFRRAPTLDGSHVVFGKVIKGMETVLNIEQSVTYSGEPSGLVQITDCGEISDGRNSNVIESDKPQIMKEASEANLQKDNDLKKYESSDEKLGATMKNNVLVTNQHPDDPSKSSLDEEEEEISNPLVFLDISIYQRPPERIVIELFADVVPKTAENFRALCVGFESATGKHLHYKGCIFYDIFKGFAQGGDFENQNGTLLHPHASGESIYGSTFPDENFQLRHSGPGILSMANEGRNTNGSRFIMCFTPEPFFDGIHVVFGKVIKGLGTVYDIQDLGSPSGVPHGRVEITNCGEISEDEKSNVIESARKEESEAKLHKDREFKRYKSYNEKLLVALKNELIVTRKHLHDPNKFSPVMKPSKKSESPQITDRGEISEDKKSNVIESDKPQCSSVRKEEAEAKPQKDNDFKKYGSYNDKLLVALNNSFHVTNQLQKDNNYKNCEPYNDKLLVALNNYLSVANQHSDDPSKSRYIQSPTCSPSPGANISGN